MSEVELAWLAGLLEGEGSFIVARPATPSGRSERVRITISLQMTDRDVVERAHRIVGQGSLHQAKRQKEHHKDTHIWRLSSMVLVMSLISLLRPNMGLRRQEQIDACLRAVDQIGGPTQRVRRHGRSKYELDGCRCDVCRAAKSAANARRYQK
jgi:hypothetical protein